MEEFVIQTAIFASIGIATGGVFFHIRMKKTVEYVVKITLKKICNKGWFRYDGKLYAVIHLENDPEEEFDPDSITIYRVNSRPDIDLFEAKTEGEA